MTKEEKAKRYDEALERAKKWYYAPNADKTPTYANRIIKEIFPELKESEDERIRKALIEYFNEQCDMSDWNGVYGYQVVAWLEKQGEQKQLKDYSTLEITDVTRQALQECESFSNIRADLYAARVGATVEDLIKKQSEQKPTWSKEDSKRLQRIIDFLWHNRKGDTDTIYQQEQDVDWLKSLRPQKQWKPTKEQMDALAWALSLAKNCGEECAFDLRTLQDQLKKLREE